MDVTIKYTDGYEFKPVVTVDSKQYTVGQTKTLLRKGHNCDCYKCTACMVYNDLMDELRQYLEQ